MKKSQQKKNANVEPVPDAQAASDVQALNIRIPRELHERLRS